MNQNEYNALQDSSLPPLAVVLYVRAFRRCMDYQTGLVAPSLGRLAMELEYNPVPCSTDKPTKATKAQVRHLVRRLIESGLISLVEKGDKNKGKSAVFRCLLARADSVRPNEEQHMNAHPRATQQNTEKASKNNIVPFNNNTSAHTHEKHRSDLSDKEESIPRTREALILDDDFIAVAKQVALLAEPDEIAALFDQFRYAVDEPLVNRVKGQWLGQWRKYCAAVRANRLSRAKQSSGGQHETGKRFNPTSHSLDAAIAAAQRNAESGTDLSVLDEIAERFGRDNTA